MGPIANAFQHAKSTLNENLGEVRTNISGKFTNISDIFSKALPRFHRLTKTLLHQKDCVKLSTALDISCSVLVKESQWPAVRPAILSDSRYALLSEQNQITYDKVIPINQ